MRILLFIVLFSSCTMYRGVQTTTPIPGAEITTVEIRMAQLDE